MASALVLLHLLMTTGFQMLRLLYILGFELR